MERRFKGQYTQEEVSDQLTQAGYPISQMNYSHYERGRSTIPAEYAGVPLCTAQAIRRWRLTKLAHENILVASLIGGNSIQVLRKHYLRPDLSAMRSVMEKTLGEAPKVRQRKLV